MNSTARPESGRATAKRKGNKMGDNYSVDLALKCKDEAKVVSLLKEYIRKNPDNAEFNLAKYKSQGVGTETLDDLIAIMLAGWEGQRVNKEAGKDGSMTYRNCFSCTYGWRRVMVGMFFAMAEALDDESGIIIDRDEGIDEYIIEDGEVTQVR